MDGSKGLGTNIREKVEEVDFEEKGPLAHETAELEWHISDDHQQNLSFSDVRPANITVRNLEVEVDITTSFMDTLKARLTKPKAGDVEIGVAGGAGRKRILKGVSGDFPAGSLTAIIGGSGSGKVRLHPIYTTPKGSDLAFNFYPPA